jgi:hypothetical protein
MSKRKSRRLNQIVEGANLNQLVEGCLVRANWLSPRQLSFVKQMSELERQPTQKQAAWLTSIFYDTQLRERNHGRRPQVSCWINRNHNSIIADGI